MYWEIIRTLIVFVVMFILPIYLILIRLNLSTSERLVYSLLIGLGLVPSLVFWVSLVIGSARAGIVVTLFGLILVSFIINRRKDERSISVSKV